MLDPGITEPGEGCPPNKCTQLSIGDGVGATVFIGGGGVADADAADPLAADSVGVTGGGVGLDTFGGDAGAAPRLPIQSANAWDPIIPIEGTTPSEDTTVPRDLPPVLFRGLL